LKGRFSKKTINETIKAKSPIVPETALKLERTLGRSAQYRSNLERNYQDDKVRLTEKTRMEKTLASPSSEYHDTLAMENAEQ
jgi:plasmid maintenance system antidote protein VapI